LVIFSEDRVEEIEKLKATEEFGVSNRKGVLELIQASVSFHCLVFSKN